MTSPQVILICSVRQEAEPLMHRLGNFQPLEDCPFPAWTREGGEFVCAAGGMGKTNAAHALTTLLASGDRKERIVVGFGIGGAFPGSGLSVGDVAVADREIYGDEGSLTPAGWISCEDIRIPLAEVDGQRFFNEFPVTGGVASPPPSSTYADFRVASGPFVTVSACSGTDERAAELERRHGAICESMEGAAYAHVATLHGIPWMEVRGISNIVENRDPSRWDIGTAAANAAAVVSEILAALPSASSE